MSKKKVAAAKTAAPKSAPAKGVTEKPLPASEATKSAEQERIENNPTGTRADGTTARHTEPLGPGAPGQRGVPGPERRVVPGDNNNVPERRELTDEEIIERNSKRGPKIRVEALKTGYIHDVRRRPGDVFDVYEDELSDKWMQRVDGKRIPRTTGAQAAINREHDAILGGKVTKAQRSTGDVDPLG